MTDVNTKKNCLIIAEAGVNHNGDLGLALDLIDAAAESGANLVKFQTFNTENLVGKEEPKAAYQIKNTNANESQYYMLKKLELKKKDYKKLVLRCSKKKISLLSTGFDIESVEFLNTLGFDYHKIPSGEITNL